MPLLRLICVQSVRRPLRLSSHISSTSFPHHSPARSFTTSRLHAVVSSTKGRAADHDRARYIRRSAANFDTIGSWNQRLSLEVDVEQSIKLGKLIPHMSLGNVGIASLLGRRKENEDRYQYLQLTPSILMFAVFDGHSGPVAADYTSEHMYRHIKFWLERGETDLQAILKTAFIDVNNAFTRHLFYNHAGECSLLHSSLPA